MFNVAKPLLALIEACRELREQRSSGTPQEVDLTDQEITLAQGGTYIVTARVTFLVEDDSDFNRETGYGSHSRATLDSVDLQLVSDAEGRPLMGQGIRGGLPRQLQQTLEQAVAEVAEAKLGDE